MVKHTFNVLEDSASTLAGHEIGQLLVSRLTETGPEEVAFVVRPIKRHYFFGCFYGPDFSFFLS